jgi:hypothetical protein
LGDTKTVAREWKRRKTVNHLRVLRQLVSHWLVSWLLSTWGICLVLLGTLALAGSTAAFLSGSYAQPAPRGGTALYNDWQHQINIHLRTVPQEEAGEQISIEYQLLRAAWRLEEQPAVSDQSQQVAEPDDCDVSFPASCSAAQRQR